MNGKVLSFIVAAVAYGITLTVAALVLSGMRISFLWALVAWALFTLSITILRPLIVQRFGKHVHGYTWVLGIVTVLLSLVLTSLLSPSSGFSIRGFWTWVWATLIVWLGTVVYDAVDDRAVAAARPHADRLQAELDERRRSRETDTPSGTQPPARPEAPFEPSERIPPTTPTAPPPMTIPPPSVEPPTTPPARPPTD